VPKVAQTVTFAPVPKKSGVIQLQCANFPKKPSESSESSEYSETSEYSDYSDDNIGSDSDSCTCDEEGPCDHHMMMQSIVTNNLSHLFQAKNSPQQTTQFIGPGAAHSLQLFPPAHTL
jgi:hypothetical protein